MTARLTTAFLLLLALALGGCVSLDPQPDLTRFYTLSMPQSTEPIANPPQLYIDRVQIPRFLASSEIFVRIDTHEMQALSGARWVEALDLEIARALAQQLSPGTPLPHDPMLRPEGMATLVLRIHRFEADFANAQVVLVADWQLIGNPTDSRLRLPESAVITQPLTSRDAQTIVEAMSAALAELAARITNP